MEVELDPLSLLEVSFGEDDERLVELPNSSVAYQQNEVDPLEIDASLTTLHSGPVRLRSIAEIQQSLVNNAETLSQISQHEQFYRHSLYKTLNIVLKKRLHCTVCDVHIGCSLKVHDPRVIHPLLRVLICTNCSSAYNKAEFQIGPNGSDILCRWCGSDGTNRNRRGRIQGLRLCENCPYAFCEQCIYRNFPLDNPGQSGWVCFVCKINELWPHRAMCWALVSLLNNLASRKTKDPVWSTDISECCKKLFKKVDGSESSKGKRLSGVVKIGTKTSPKSKNVIPNEIKLVSSNLPVSPPASDKAEVETLWLKSKVKCISANMRVIDDKINSLGNKLYDIDRESNVSQTMDTVLTILSFARRQLEEYSEDLKRDWESRKPSTSSVIAVTTANMNGSFSVEKDKSVNSKSDSNRNLLRKYKVKPCFVKLQKFSLVK